MDERSQGRSPQRRPLAADLVGGWDNTAPSRAFACWKLLRQDGEERLGIDKAKAVTQLTELTPELLHEFVDRIIVHKPEQIDGKRTQQVEIVYNGVGIIREPSPEEMEEYFQAHIRRNTAKTA